MGSFVLWNQSVVPLYPFRWLFIDQTTQRGLFEKYSKCETAAEVIQAQEEWIKMCENEKKIKSEQNDDPWHISEDEDEDEEEAEIEEDEEEEESEDDE